jgi:hypothetical protein
MAAVVATAVAIEAVVVAAAAAGLTGAVEADPVEVVALVVAADPEAAVVVVDRMAVAVLTAVTKIFILQRHFALPFSSQTCP